MAILPLNLARVSNLLQTGTVSQSLSSTQAALLDVENQLSTGKKINQPSDDPGGAAIAQQLHKTLEARQTFSDNLKTANSQLSQVDSSLGDLTDLLNQAQSIASKDVGTDVTDDERKSDAQIVQQLYDQALTISNTQLDGTYLFGGDKATSSPFVETKNGVQFVGSDTTLENQFDDDSVLSFQVDGGKVFGAPSTRVQGSTDLTPVISTATRLSDLRGAAGDGVPLGTIQVSDGTTTKSVDLSTADSVGDVINAINNAGVGDLSASIGSDGKSIAISGAASGDNISVTDPSGGSTAADLGIAATNAGTTLAGTSVQPILTPLTTLASLRGGAGLDTTGFTITNGNTSAGINLTGATTVEDLLNKINGSGTGVSAAINASGTGIDLLNATQGAAMTIAENGGTTAAELGVRSFDASTPLAQLNDGKGVGTASGADFQITDSNGVAFDVDVDGATTIQDVIDKINTAAGSASAGVTASFATSGNGIVLTDTAGGTGTIALAAQNFSTAAKDLGLTTAASGSTITGTDVNAVTADGIFSHLAKLRDALNNSDSAAITEAAQGLTDDNTRVVAIRGDTGSRVQGLQSRSDQIDDENTATQSLLSSVEDVDYTSAITQFQTLQTALQAGYETAQRTMNLSLLDFLD